MRLRRRYGAAIDEWFDALPSVLDDLAERWELEWGPLIQRGSMSVVVRGERADGSPAVMKISPDRERLAYEAAALARWTTVHVPRVLGVDESVGALLLEAVEPGTPVSETAGYPSTAHLAALITSLQHGVLDPSYPSLTDRVAHLFDSGTKPYERTPELVEVVPRELYDRGRVLALALTADTVSTVLLHGDLTPVNVLDGGAERGLVAIDPAPCLGDPAFDTVDLVFWRAKDVDEIAARAGRLAPAIGADAGRILQWCTAFAAMVALELAEVDGTSRPELEPLLELAARAGA
jgi:streptomycin 6-kinase